MYNHTPNFCHTIFTLFESSLDIIVDRRQLDNGVIRVTLNYTPAYPTLWKLRSRSPVWLFYFVDVNLIG